MRRFRTLVALVAVALLAAACSSTTASAVRPATSPVTAGFPVSLTTSTGTVHLRARPTSIISLSPSATDMLYAIGAGSQVRAVDDDSTYPPQAPRTKLSGLDPNVEAILTYHPDLVIISYNPDNLAAALEKFHVPVLYEGAPSNIAGIYAQIEQLGRATGRRVGAAKVVASMQHRIATIRASVHAHHLSYYFELSSTYYSATSSTFIGSVLGLLGLRNIADAAKGAGSGYPQLSAEYIVASDPDIIFLDDDATPAEVAARPGWGDITAVREHHVYVLNQNIASQWGPRIVDLLASAAADVARAAA
jgi:iron complex transport system substrate-binding protein